MATEAIIAMDTAGTKGLMGFLLLLEEESLSRAPIATILLLVSKKMCGLLFCSSLLPLAAKELNNGVCD